MTLTWQLKPAQVTHELSQVQRCVQGQLVNGSAEADVMVQISGCVWSRKVEAFKQACDSS